MLHKFVCYILRVNIIAHCKLSMIAVIPLLVTLVLSTASPLKTRQFGFHPCRNHSIPTPQHCSDAINRYQHLLQRFYNLTFLTTPTHDPQALSETIAMFQSVLGVVCAGECLEPFVGCFRTVTEANKNETLFTTCARAEDGTFCGVKLHQATYERSRHSSRLCTTPGMCSSACQQYFRDLKTRFGCCTTNYFKTPSSPLIGYYKRYLANCSVPIGTPCNSASALAGAAIVYLNVVLVIAVLLVTITIA